MYQSAISIKRWENKENLIFFFTQTKVVRDYKFNFFPFFLFSLFSFTFFFVQKKRRLILIKWKIFDSSADVFLHLFLINFFLLLLLYANSKASFNLYTFFYFEHQPPPYPPVPICLLSDFFSPAKKISIRKVRVISVKFSSCKTGIQS